jgi:hypothetical protein
MDSRDQDINFELEAPAIDRTEYGPNRSEENTVKVVLVLSSHPVFC